MNSFPCTVCGEQGHSSRKCKALSAPLENGFYKPQGGYRESGDDDEHSRLIKTYLASITINLIPKQVSVKAKHNVRI